MATTADPTTLRFRTQAWIAGRWVDPVGGGTCTSENPATGRPLAEVAACDARDGDRVIEAGCGVGAALLAAGVVTDVRDDVGGRPRGPNGQLLF